MLVRRGELAKSLGLSWPTVKYYTEVGLFTPVELTPHGQFLYDLEKNRSRNQLIQNLKIKRFTLSEIKTRLILEGLN
ncbi:MAG: MerR family transcriptional regulator [Chlamydiae bacterium]|nr:MerR family transcriptional regulator [Chlamydiota bacterium]MBI3266599.1 MerR family transcriptional regulator [Chlamydiota bacterium]